MEQARLFIAIALSFLVLFAWNFFFPEQSTPPVEDAQVIENTDGKTPAPAADVAVTPDRAGPAPVPSAVVPGRTPKTFTVDTPLYKVKISDRGAVVESFVLKAYRETVDPDSPPKEMVVAPGATGTMELSLDAKSIPGLADAFFEADAPTSSMDVAAGKKSVTFKWVSPEGIVVEKIFSFSAESYLVDYTVRIVNRSDRSVNDKLVLAMNGTAPADKRAYGFEGPCALIDDALERVKVKKIEDKNLYPGKISWVALQDRYFMSSVMPDQTDDGSMRLFLGGEGALTAQYVRDTGLLGPGAQKDYAFSLFMGPKTVSILKTLGHKLEKSVNFGWFDFIAKPCLWLMNLIYSFIPNYGISIILLTILIKVLFWPLGTKSYRSMNEMKKLQPLMAEIREKYKHDKAKMNEEVMGLYKTYKINPMSGCLPMVAQMPIFFALYRMLYEAVELRHAPFFGWISDLSAPDRLLQFDFAIPFMQAPSGIPVLTLVMGATMFLQQKMSPPAGDPAQAKMMMMMPLVFTVIFVNFSSGLVLYWLVNNVLSISQQYYITKTNA